VRHVEAHVQQDLVARVAVCFVDLHPTPLPKQKTAD
jgi:hypothetical protein